MRHSNDKDQRSSVLVTKQSAKVAKRRRSGQFPSMLYERNHILDDIFKSMLPLFGVKTNLADLKAQLVFYFGHPSKGAIFQLSDLEEVLTKIQGGEFFNRLANEVD